ncbi:MAG: hypothetical protein QW201_01830, partial [Thermoproteota archaeon]
SYMVPSVLIKHFLEDVKDKKYDGVPDLCISWQELENPDLRESMGKKARETVKLKCSLERTCNSILDVLKETVNESNTRI